MPRLVHRPPKYSLHKSTNQAVVHHQGKKVFLGPYGSAKSHRGYRNFLQTWHDEREAEQSLADMESRYRIESITAASLREKRFNREPVTITELVLVYRKHTSAPNNCKT